MPRDARRVKPRPSVDLHASKLEEALAVDRHAIPIPIQGQLSTGETHCTEVLIPQAFTYLLMKLCAYRDRLDDPDKNLGQHHALDIYRIVGLLTQDEDADVRSLSAEFAQHFVVIDAREIAATHFISPDGIGEIANSGTPALFARTGSGPFGQRVGKTAGCYAVIKDVV